MNILAGAPGGGHTGGEDGWQAVPSRPARGQFEKVALYPRENLMILND